MRVLSFCAHQPFLYLFKGMKLELDLIQHQAHRRFLQNWDPRVRPLPQGWRLVAWPQAQTELQSGRYQAVIAHNINDYIDFLPYKVPRVMVVHTSLSSRLTEERVSINIEEYRRDLFQLVQKTAGRLVFVSEHKRDDWRLPGDVIHGAVDPDDYSGYAGDVPKVLRVANQLVERGEILNVEAHRRITRDLPIQLLGNNPRDPSARIAESWDDLREAYRHHRLYVHTTKPQLEDGYNLAMLEAMATGMPVVGLAHPTSPLVDGVNGFVSEDLDVLRMQVKRLLEDPELARTLGEGARRTILQHFHIQNWHDRWRQLLNEITGEGLSSH